MNKCILQEIWLSVHQPVLKFVAFGSHCSANFQPILDCFIPNFKLTYEDSENINADRVSTVDFNLHRIKRRAFFGTPGRPRLSLPKHKGGAVAGKDKSIVFLAQ